MAVWNPCANDIFLQALEISPGGRSAFLEEACGTDSVLRAQVEALFWPWSDWRTGPCRPPTP